MAKNYSEDRMERRVPNTINKVMNEQKRNRSNQFQGLGFFPAPTGTTDPANATIGSLYYNTSTNKLRLKTNTGWIDLH
jgi:hypothetical protein